MKKRKIPARATINPKNNLCRVAFHRASVHYLTGTRPRYLSFPNFTAKRSNSRRKQRVRFTENIVTVQGLSVAFAVAMGKQIHIAEYSRFKLSPTGWWLKGPRVCCGGWNHRVHTLGTGTSERPLACVRPWITLQTYRMKRNWCVKQFKRC